jgi:hypothetical protein
MRAGPTAGAGEVLEAVRLCRFTDKWRFEAAQKKKKAPIFMIPASRTDSNPS